MSTTETKPQASNSSTESISYDVFVSDLPPHNNGFLPNGERKEGLSRREHADLRE